MMSVISGHGTSTSRGHGNIVTWRDNRDETSKMTLFRPYDAISRPLDARGTVLRMDSRVTRELPCRATLFLCSY